MYVRIINVQTGTHRYIWPMWKEIGGGYPATVGILAMNAE